MEREEKIGKASRMIYICSFGLLSQARRRRQLGGQLCAPLPEYLIPSLVFLISPPVSLFRLYLISSELDDSFAGSLSGVRRPPPPLLSTPYLRGKGPGAVLSFPKAETQPSNPESRESRSSNSNSATNYRLSPPLSLHHLLRHISYYYLIIISRARERIIIGRVSRLLFRSGRSIETR